MAPGLLGLVVVDGQPRAQLIAELLPSSARWWAAFGPLPVIAAIWGFEAWRHGGLKHMRKFVADNAT